MYWNQCETEIGRVVVETFSAFSFGTGFLRQKLSLVVWRQIACVTRSPRSLEIRWVWKRKEGFFRWRRARSLCPLDSDLMWGQHILLFNFNSCSSASLSCNQTLLPCFHTTFHRSWYFRSIFQVMEVKCRLFNVSPWSNTDCKTINVHS